MAFKVSTYIKSTEHDIDKRKKETENTPVQKFFGSIEYGIRRNKQAYQRRSSRMSQPKKTDRQYQQKSTPLHHNRPYISESAFSIAPGYHNLRTCTKAKGYRKNANVKQSTHGRSTEFHFTHSPQKGGICHINNVLCQ